MNGFRALESLILSFNPIVNDNKSAYIYEILTRLTDMDNLKRINKHVITKAMRKACMEWLDNEKKTALEERRRKEKEEEEKANIPNDEN